MTPPPARRRRGSSPERSFPRRGSVRRSQMITTYGVGSLIAVDNESFIVCGTDSWNVNDAPRIDEHRLAQNLGVKYFRLPPASDDTSRDGVRVRRFPLWHSCPRCGTLQHVRGFNSPPGKNECGDCEEELVPSRFVMACARGHIDDFPYWKWAHRNNRRIGETGSCGGKMRLRSSGKTASLRSILISCTCGVPEVSMEGAFRSRALSELKVRCDGRRPWLKNDPVKPCTEAPRTLQRGSSVVWHPIVKTALSIPPWSGGLAARLADHWDELRVMTRDEIKIYLKAVTIKESYEFSLDSVLELLEAESHEDGEDVDEQIKDSSHVALRRKEYERLIEGKLESSADREEQFICEPPKASASALTPYGLTGPMLVKRLREVRALTAFSRVDTPDTHSDVHKAELFLTPQEWLPAMEVQGEGVFLRLDERRLDAWAQNIAVAARVERIRNNQLRRLRVRTGDPTAAPAHLRRLARCCCTHSRTFSSTSGVWTAVTPPPRFGNGCTATTTWLDSSSTPRPATPPEASAAWSHRANRTNLKHLCRPH